MKQVKIEPLRVALSDVNDRFFLKTIQQYETVCENPLTGNIAKVSLNMKILVSHTIGKLSLSWIQLCHVDDDLSCSRADIVHGRKF